MKKKEENGQKMTKIQYEERLAGLYGGDYHHPRPYIGENYSGFLAVVGSNAAPGLGAYYVQIISCINIIIRKDIKLEDCLSLSKTSGLEKALEKITWLDEADNRFFAEELEILAPKRLLVIGLEAFDRTVNRLCPAAETKTTAGGAAKKRLVLLGPPGAKQHRWAFGVGLNASDGQLDTCALWKIRNPCGYVPSGPASSDRFRIRHPLQKTSLRDKLL
jgi:hypothetical protein